MIAFVDASVWIPMQLPRDQYSSRVMELLHVLNSADAKLVTSNWTLYEALAVARRRAFRAAEQLFVLASSQSRVLPVTSEIEAEALRRFLTWSDKSASVVDHANLLVAVRERCDAILSFDEDFAPLVAATGLRLLR